MSQRKLSNLELTVLGLTWLRGPCTIYAVMRELSLSESTYHRSRAGTAYSVARRLISFGLLSEVSSQIEVTDRGVEALRAWMSTPVPRVDVAHSADLIRLRFFFLGVVDREQRLAFIDDALEGLREFLTTCERLLPENQAIGDYFGVLASASTILETRARIRWLQLVRECVATPITDQESWSSRVMELLED